MPLRPLLLMLLLTLAAIAAAQDLPSPAEVDPDQPFPLLLGDPAPPLHAGAWLKGDPVDAFQPGRVYVIEFWATWCGPCIQALPHLVSLQERYGEQVGFVAQSIWEIQPERVAPFVEEMGEKMPFAIATDRVPEGKEANEGLTAVAWLEASGQIYTGIPRTAVVDGKGRLAWFGHPNDLDEPLAAIVAGEWDIAAHLPAYRQSMVDVARLAPLKSGYDDALGRQDWAGADRHLAALIEHDPGRANVYEGQRYWILLDLLKDEPAAYALGRRLMEGPFHDDAQQLNRIAWMIVNPRAQRARPDLELALEAATRANELMGSRDADTIDTLARAHHLRGERARAIELQERAVELASDEDKASLRETLELYRASAGAKPQEGP